jgi:hypothetical protein
MFSSKVFYTISALFTAQISGNMDFIICLIFKKMRPHLNFDILPQDVLSAPPGEGWEWGRNIE